MANWAIVAGIDQYWRVEFNLKACVRDAVTVTQWLLNSKGGNVLPQNLYLLTRPTPPPPELDPIPIAVEKWDARFADLVQVAERLTLRSGAKGDRFFFYFSGHGITNASGIDAEEAIVMADFDDTHTNNALELRSFIEYFKSTRFAQQFFIVDACRDVPDFGKKFRTGEFPLVGDDIDPKLPTVQQYTLLSTSPRIKSAIIGERSAFTEELLNGLQGKGTAIALDYKSAKGEYVVSTNRLFKFVETQIVNRKINVSDDEANPIFQKPRINGEHGSEDPELARLSADEVAKANLRVFVKPNPEVWPKAELRVVNQFGDVKGNIKGITNDPESLQLLPMIYTVTVTASGYKAERERWSFDLYEDQDLPVSLIPSLDNVIPESAIVAGSDINVGGDLNRAGGDVVTKGLGNAGDKLPGVLLESASPTTLTVKASDPLARLELADSQGQVFQTGQKEISAHLSPGFYRARLLTPEGQIVEKLVELTAGENEKVTLEPSAPQQSPLLKQIMDKGKFTVLPDNALDVSESVGAMASAQLSTILALTGSVLNQDEKWGHRLRNLGLKSFKELASDANNGLHILSVVESDSSERGSDQFFGTKLRLWPIDGPEPESSTGRITESKTKGLFEFAQAAEPGSYFLSIEPPDAEPVVFALAILPNRVTMLIFHRDAAGQSRVFQYNLSQEQAKKTDPLQLRRLELAQRFYLSGRLDYALETARELLYAKWVDPLAGCLGCYLMLKLGKPNELSIAVTNMVTQYYQLSDSHLLRGEFKASIDETESARESFVRALDCGVPVFADGLTRLYDAVQKYQLQEHPRVVLLSEMVNKRVRGFLWTAWMPSKEVHPARQVSITVNAGVIKRDEITAGRDVNTAQGDIVFAGRDNIKVQGDYTQYVSGAQQSDALEEIFSDLNTRSCSLTEADEELVGAVIEKAGASARMIQQGNDDQELEVKLESRLKALLSVAPNLGRVALEQLSDPTKKVAPEIRNIAKKLMG